MKLATTIPILKYYKNILEEKFEPGWGDSCHAPRTQKSS